jgi:hypothetical protein
MDNHLWCHTPSHAPLICFPFFKVGCLLWASFSCLSKGGDPGGWNGMFLCQRSLSSNEWPGCFLLSLPHSPRSPHSPHSGPLLTDQSEDTFPLWLMITLAKVCHNKFWWFLSPKEDTAKTWSRDNPEQLCRVQNASMPCRTPLLTLFSLRSTAPTSTSRY